MKFTYVIQDHSYTDLLYTSDIHLLHTFKFTTALMMTYGSLLIHSLPAFFLDKVKPAVSAARESGYGSFPIPPAWVCEEKVIFSVQVLLGRDLW